MYILKPPTVMVTRPGKGGEDLCMAIEQNGAKAIYFPTIVFGPPKDPFAFKYKMAKLDEYDWMVFTSPQAVYVSVDMLRAFWPILPPHLKIAAVGGGTAKALHQCRLPIDVCPRAEWNSEGLLDALMEDAVKDKHIAIVRGEGGREYLEQALTVRGARATPIVAYQRLLPVVDVRPYQELIHAGKVDRIVCTSFEGACHLKQLIGEAIWPFLQLLPLIVISSRMKMLAQESGFQTIWVAGHASQEAILATALGRPHRK